MNRIYQGRVTKVEVLDGKDWRPLEDWSEKLWRHHELFQDAVNYYILALASLADPAHATNRFIKDLRKRVAAAWAEFPRATGGDARSLRQSVQRWLGLVGSTAIEDAFDVVLCGNEAAPQVRALALALLLDRCGGESAIQKGGRGYLPRFCDAKSKPTYDFSSESQAAGAGKDRLALILHGIASENEFSKIADEMSLSWVVKLQPDEYFTPQESSARLAEAVEHVLGLLRDASAARTKEVSVEFPDFENQLRAFKAGINDLSKIVIPRNRKASKDLTFAALTFKFFPCLLTGKVLSLFVKKPKARGAVASSSELDFACCGDDPINLARGSRGYVFRAFTALPAWNPKSPGEPAWKEFDIAAFKEALKSLNQFNQKTQERVDEESNLRGQIAIMLGSGITGWKPRKTETNEEEPTPDPLEPKLFQLARELERDLTQELADTVVGGERSATFGEAVYKYREGEWQVSRASLRGYSDIAEEWNALGAKLGENLTQEQLEETVKKHQREEKNKRSIGSIPLFLRLCEKRYWPLWQELEEDSDDIPSDKLFLDAMASFHAKVRDFERSQEPINLTTAEPRRSRRLYMFSDLTDKTAKVVFGKAGDAFTIECAIAVSSGHCAVKEQRVRLHYTGRRLLRDELQGGVESRWLQPMTRALGLKPPENPDPVPFESAVSLMPDFVGAAGAAQAEELRFLLNFPVTLDPAWIHSGLGKAAIWRGQFNGTQGKNLHLHWPGTIKGKSGDSRWWKNRKIINQGFSCISVDLGQRTAGAWALLRVTCWNPRNVEKSTRRPVRKIGFDGERTWFAEVLSTGLLRLPGEDMRVREGGDKLEVERFGKAGRNALEPEWRAAKELAAALLAENPETWVGTTCTEKSFPEQNDALIALANRRLSRLNTFHRWSCFDPERAEVAARRSSLIEKLVEELEHWDDLEVKSWKTLVERGGFQEFRNATGAAFHSLRARLGEHLVKLANRIAPLRNRSWQWELTGKNLGLGLYGELVDTGEQLTKEPVWLRGQRGLSLARIEQLEGLRRLFLRYNRSFDREAGKPAKFGRADLGRKSGEPCRALLEKIDRVKDERVNQTAHLILAEALGVRLREHQIDAREREARDIHGEYQRIPGREPVDFIVIENLDRYRTSQGRAPSENSRLMKWCHRLVRDKIKMLAEEPFGIAVVEAGAAYSSRFCAVTGAAGARCEELSELDDYRRKTFERRASQPPKPGQPAPGVFATLLRQFDQLEKLNAEFRRVRTREGKDGNARLTLFVPQQGGPLFLPVARVDSEAQGGMPRQADINAAINIGLRAVADPNAFEILHKIRAEKEGDNYRPVIKNAREKAAFDTKAVISLNNEASNKLAKARTPNFFYDSRAFDCFDSARLNLSDKMLSLVSGVGLWATVNQAFPDQIVRINQQRLRGWQRRFANEETLPM